MEIQFEFDNANSAHFDRNDLDMSLEVRRFFFESLIFEFKLVLPLLFLKFKLECVVAIPYSR